MTKAKAKTKSKTKAKPTKRRRKKQLTRIYYGPDGLETTMYWTVEVTDAKQPVTVNGTVAAAMRAHRGVTVGCALSLVGMDSASQFGHEVYLISVTKSTLLAVDRLNKAGQPCHAVRYGHRYGQIVECNDDGSLKKMVKQSPELIERPFHLTPPRKRPTGTHGNHKRTVSGKGNRVFASAHHLQGALARAVAAGRIASTVAEQLSRAMSKRKKQLAAAPAAEPSVETATA